MVRLITLGGLLLLAACQTGPRASFAEMFTGSLQDDSQQPRGPLVSVGDVPFEVLVACRETLAAQAQSLGATWLEAASAGAFIRLPDGITEAPIEARITYQSENRVQVRQARITCRLNDQGAVTELL